MDRRAGRVTPEALAATLLAGPAAVMIAASLLDLVRLPLAPWVLAVTGGVGGATIMRAVVRSSAVSTPSRSVLEAALFLSIATGVCGYLLWLASPSLLPIADGPDIVHHLSLIHEIQRTQRLPHGPAMESYLGEMVNYTPGSHVLAATVAAWLRIDPLRLVYAVMAVAVGLKGALLFLITLRIAPESKAVIPATAAPVLVMVPAAYFVGSILKFGFYAQIVSETFAVGMLLAAVLWARNGTRMWLTVFAVCGGATFLAWPVWVPPGMIALFVMVVVRRATMIERCRDMLIAFGPIILVAMLHVATHRGGASILGSAGLATAPSWRLFGATFIGLAFAGALLAWRDVAGRAVVLFSAAVALQALGLAALNRLAGTSSLYLPYKMVYLLVLSGAVLAAFALGHLAARVPRGHRALGTVSAVLPLAVAVPLAWGSIPHHRQQSPITDSTYVAGVWAREHLPVACVDYFSRHWLTGYWLHLDVLGNPRVSPRMREETFEFRETVGKWIEGRGLPYAIVEDMSSIPREVRPMMEPLQLFGSTVVVRHRAAPAAACR